MYGGKKGKKGIVEHGFCISSLRRKVDVSALHCGGTNIQIRLLGKIMSSVWDTV